MNMMVSVNVTVPDNGFGILSSVCECMCVCVGVHFIALWFFT